MELLQYLPKQEVFGIETSYRLGLMHEISIRSFLAHGHAYTLYGMKEYANLPEGCNYLPLKPYVPHEIYLLATDRTHDIQNRAAQLYLLHTLGGFYVDSDIICLSNSIPGNIAYLDSTVWATVLPGVMKLPAGTAFAENVLYSILRPAALMPWDGAIRMRNKIEYPDQAYNCERDLDPIALYAAAESTGLEPYCQHNAGPWIQGVTDYLPIWFPAHRLYKKILNRWSISMLLDQYWMDHFTRDSSTPKAVYKFLQDDAKYSLMRYFIQQYCPFYDKNIIKYY